MSALATGVFRRVFNFQSNRSLQRMSADILLVRFRNTFLKIRLEAYKVRSILMRTVENKCIQNITRTLQTCVQYETVKQIVQPQTGLGVVR